jgi:glycerol-3-phosphate cytidylyltransferase
VNDIQTFDADVFVMGSDWDGEFDFLKAYCEIVYLDRTAGVSTTERKALITNGDVKLADWTDC